MDRGDRGPAWGAGWGRAAALAALVFAAAFAGVWAGSEFRHRRAGDGPPPSVLVPGSPFPDVPVIAPGAEAPRGTEELLAGAGGVVLFLKLDCLPCGRTVAAWQRAIDNGELDGVPVIGLTLDPLERIPAYRAGKGITFPVYNDPGRVFLERYRVRSVPLVVVVDRHGRIVADRSAPGPAIDGGELHRLLAG